MKYKMRHLVSALAASILLAGGPALAAGGGGGGEKKVQLKPAETLHSIPKTRAPDHSEMLDKVKRTLKNRQDADMRRREMLRKEVERRNRIRERMGLSPKDFRNAGSEKGPEKPTPRDQRNTPEQSAQERNKQELLETLVQFDQAYDAFSLDGDTKGDQVLFVVMCGKNQVNSSREWRNLRTGYDPNRLSAIQQAICE